MSAKVHINPIELFRTRIKALMLLAVLSGIEATSFQMYGECQVLVKFGSLFGSL